MDIQKCSPSSDSEDNALVGTVRGGTRNKHKNFEISDVHETVRFYMYFPDITIVITTQSSQDTAKYTVSTSSFVSYEKVLEKIMRSDYGLTNFFIDSYTDEEDITTYFVSDKDSYETLYSAVIE